MRQFIIYTIILLSFNGLFAQQFLLNGQKQNAQNALKSTTEFAIIDAKVKSYGQEYRTPTVLAEQILKDFESKKDRIRALYTWLCLNVKYDLALSYSGQTAISFKYTSKADFNRKMKTINNNLVTKTLRTNKALCEGFAQTFKQVSERLGIQCEVIGGYVKSDASDINNQSEDENHAWNAVKIDEKWYLIDTTWGAGYSIGERWTAQFNDYYFFTNPTDFSLTHYPTDSKWFLTESTLTKEQFYEMPIYKTSYFENNLDLISPKKGIIMLSSNNDITFLLGNLSESTPLYYAYKGDKNSQKIQMDCNNSQCNFVIPFSKKNDSELYIFANQRPILEFLVKRN